MNSPYVETDEQQLQWLSNASFDNMLACAGIGSVAEFGLMGERRPRYRVNASLGDLGSYSVQEAQYQHQPAVAWNNIDPVESTGFQFGPGCFATAASLWAIPYPGFHPAVALSELYSHDDLPTQFYSVPELQATPGNSSGSIVQSDGITHLTSISPGSGPSSSRAEYMIPTKLMEVKRVDPPMLPSADGTMPRPQSPRFVGDEYAAPWVRGSGVERTGWCGFCPTWHRLKDSQYVNQMCEALSVAQEPSPVLEHLLTSLLGIGIICTTLTVLAV